LTLARVHESIPSNVREQNVAWGRATTVAAASMALAGYAYSAIFNASGGNHRLLFLIAAVALGIALIVDVGMPFVFGRKVERSGLSSTGRKCLG
jgi:hypothetical protein